ncbi:MAG: peptidoglycan DD-metalloendopeptidase family protein [Bacteroidota bacterium]
MVLRFAWAPGDSASGRTTPSRIGLELTPDSILHFVRADSLWTARLEQVPSVLDTVRVSAVIETSLWSAHLGGDVARLGPGGFEDLVFDLAEVFAWKVDFTRDLRKGDALRVAVERKVRPDGSIRSRHFLAIELRNAGRVLCAIPVARPNGGWTYFDETGRSLRGAFLRYPVPYRITSRFAGRRFNPVLKIYRPHEGIDYGAPTGTPVEATASGIVTRAGWGGGYGRFIELRHAQGIRTRYAHLSAIAAWVRPGAHVEQGQIIGKVGMTGLATGPHLHYEFILNGHHRDPLTVDMPVRVVALGGAQMAAFAKDRDHALGLLEGVTIPYEYRFASAERPSRGRIRQP